MRVYCSALWLVLFCTFALSPHGLGQLPDHLSGSSALAEAKKRLVPLVHSKQSTKAQPCLQALLLPKDERRAYWELINDAFFARMAERDSVATTEEVERGLQAINDKLTEYLTTSGNPTRASLLGTLFSAKYGHTEREATSVDIHLLAIDLLSQFYILQRLIPRSEDAYLSKQYMDALLRASLQVDAVSLTLVDPLLTPLLDRLIAELSLEFFRIGQHVFGIEIRRASARGPNAVVEFLESRIQRTVPLISFQLSEPEEERLATVESALNVSYFMATAGPALLNRPGDDGKLAVTAWVDEVARSVALTQSLFLAGFFRLCRLNFWKDFNDSPMESLQAAAKWLEQAAGPLSEQVGPADWDEARHSVRRSGSLGSQADLFVEQAIPLLDAGATAPYNVNFVKNSIVRYVRQKGTAN